MESVAWVHKKKRRLRQLLYVFFDRMRDKDGSQIYRTKAGFNYPIQKDKNGSYKIKSGEMIRVCMTSDFFLAEADEWRDEAWDLMRLRSDVIFFLLTKRPERAAEHLPKNWGDGWDNIISMSQLKISAAQTSAFLFCSIFRLNIRALCARRLSGRSVSENISKRVR